MSAAATWWRSIPRAGRWGAMGAAGLALYFAVVEPALDARTSAHARADALQAMLNRRAVDAAQDSDTTRALALASAQFGAVLPPGGPERASDLSARIEAIFRERSVGGLTVKARAPIAMPRGSFDGAIPEGKQAQRLVLDVEFEASPATAFAVLADMERAPEIATIARLTIRRVEREGREVVLVSVAPEAWVIGVKGGSR